MLYAMEPIDADWYTQGGFWLSAAGVAVSTIGLAATYYQVLKARKSADAARDASKITSQENQANFNRYLAATVHRQLSEVEVYVSDTNWLMARLRCDDMASILAQLLEPSMAEEYRLFAIVFQEIPPNKRKPFDKPKWNELILATKRRVDDLTAPFVISRGKP